MAELLLELFSEEIPARLQARAADDLRRLMVDGLLARGLEVGEARAFATPRRLALVIQDVPDGSPGVSEERKGPRVGAPEIATQGFLKGAGLTALDQAEIVKDEKKGDYYLARIEKPGRPAAEIIADVVPDVVTKFPWSKSMRWGPKYEASLVTEKGDKIVTEAGDKITATIWLRWVRPLHSIICLLDGKVVRFEIAGIKAGDTTAGHRFL